jgi:hypothetical protein
LNYNKANAIPRWDEKPHGEWRICGANTRNERSFEYLGRFAKKSSKINPTRYAGLVDENKMQSQQMLGFIPF